MWVPGKLTNPPVTLVFLTLWITCGALPALDSIHVPWEAIPPPAMHTSQFVIERVMEVRSGSLPHHGALYHSGLSQASNTAASQLCIFTYAPE